jgi:hypothetical protein
MVYFYTNVIAEILELTAHATGQNDKSNMVMEGKFKIPYSDPLNV